MKPAANFHLRSDTPQVAAALGRIRWRIRALVVLEGLALSLICVVVMFWLALAIDYLPVKFGLNELSKTARSIVLALTVLSTGWLVWRFILKRVFASLKDTSIALLIERKYPAFNESLLTTVERAKERSRQELRNGDNAMLHQAAEHANDLCKNVSAAEVLNHRHVLRRLQIAGVAIVSLILFAVISPAAARTSVSRLYFLDQEKWPRQNHIQLSSLRVEFQNPVQGIKEFTNPLAPQTTANTSPYDPIGVYHVAKGATVNLSVRAQTEAIHTTPNDHAHKKAPASCVMRFQKPNGTWSSQTLNRIGNAPDGWQTFRLRGTPLASISENLTFYVQGGDHRIGPFEIKVVDQPLVESAGLDCVFPRYMVDQESGRWTPRSIPISGRMAIPVGTNVDVVAATNRTLSKVYAIDQNTGKMTDANITANGFNLPINMIDGNQDIAFFMVDQHGVVSETPHRITIDAVEDQPPLVESQLSGIGSAITANAVIPLVGKATDDYEVDSV